MSKHDRSVRSTLVNRRQIISGAAALGLSSIIAKVGSATTASKRPNIIFIVADDLGFADLSCYGRRDYSTPAIDIIATEGMRFTHAYANSAVCSATRTALITGRYQDRLAIGLEEPLVDRDVGLPPSHPTLPSLLRDGGYETWLIGKWHLGRLPKFGPLQSGYDHFWGFRGGAVDYFSHDALGQHDLWDDDREIHCPGYLTELLGNRAVGIIDEQTPNGKPFFISLHFNAPHWPWEGPDDKAESERLAQMPKSLTSAYHLDGGSMQTYADIVTSMDKQIGRVLAKLDERGLADNTIVIFTSDNGGERFSDTWPFSGKKTELLEGGLRIPSVIRWPDRIAPGTTSDQVTMSMDWVPTILSAAGVRADAGFPLDGMDLTGTISGAAATPRTVCWRYYNLGQEACRSGNWKYLKILNNTFLFNVVDDPLERANLKDREPEIFARVKAQYDIWNSDMLPLDPNVFTAGFTGSELADHFGIRSRRTIPSD